VGERERERDRERDNERREGDRGAKRVESDEVQQERAR
jgi:hypothetical protein